MTSDEGNKPNRRRRGLALEEAILDAAWSDLSTNGYARFTFETVARMAGTSRPVLYRRWSTRASLASSAIVRHLKRNPIIVPDLGNLRDELQCAMRKFADRAPPSLMKLVFEMHEDMALEEVNFTDARFSENPIGDVIARGVARGEIDPQRLNARVMRVLPSLVMHEIVVTAQPISDQTISAIIDQIFMPLTVPLP
ncbi:TetR/AcrR family transcriptional regulator [Sphingobium sp. AP50]|uniref:TetR/AcrR family transcriptional regulator n=1 Tax=Sphingobium sp. AP50 TaxID=1884369 RepID=UPI000B8994C5|nr:TetR/AcrR family transcriptional regulator [Sphingobium sp. AP50]